MTTVLKVSREEFLDRRWQYKPGEHVTLLAPTQQGKTTLAYELMQRSTTERLRAVSLVMKPRDRTVRRLAAAAEHRIIKTWPPAELPWKRPPGYVLWPVQRPRTPEQDDLTMFREFSKVTTEVYQRGDRILFADEVYGLCEDLRMDRSLIAIWTRGAGMGAGLWAATQKPSHIPLFAYSQAEHVFLGPEPDKRGRDRFAEIGGVDPDLVKHVVTRLDRYQWLYIRRTGRVMCIVDK